MTADTPVSVPSPLEGKMKWVVAAIIAVLAAATALVAEITGLIDVINGV